MNKPMMLMIALGISIAPVALAVDRPDRVLQKEVVEKTGEQPASIILSRMDGAAGCNLHSDKPIAVAPGSARERLSVGTAHVAR